METNFYIEIKTSEGKGYRHYLESLGDEIDFYEMLVKQITPQGIYEEDRK